MPYTRGQTGGRRRMHCADGQEELEVARSLVLVAFVLFGTGGAALGAQEIGFVELTGGVQSLAGKAEYIRTDNRVGPSAALASPGFSPLVDSPSGPTMRGGATWYRFHVRNPNHEQWYIHFLDPTISNTELYAVSADGPHLLYQSGRRIDFASRPVTFLPGSVDLPLPTVAQQMLLLRVTDTWHAVPLRLVPQAFMLSSIDTGFPLVAAILGITIFIAALALALRDRSLAIAVAFLICFCFGPSADLVAAWLLPNVPNASGVFEWLILGWYPLVAAFVWTFLGMRRSVLDVLLAVTTLASLVFFFAAPLWSMSVFQFIIAHPPLLLTLADAPFIVAVLMGLRAMREGQHGALWFTVAFLGPAVGQLVDTVPGMLNLPIKLPDLLSDLSTKGVLWLAIGVAIAVADRVIASEKAQRVAIARALQISERYAAAARRFVPDDFLRELGHVDIAEVQLGDQVEREMAVLFSDIRSFTSLSEGMTPGETMTFINEYLANAGPIVREHGGFIDKYIGDAIMALFKDPDAALRAAVGLQDALHRFNETRRARGQRPVAIGVGVHAGKLMLGTVGEVQRIDTTVIADAVNVASRVEGLTKTYGVGIVVTDDLVHSLREKRDDLRELGETHVKGLERTILVYACEPT